MTIELDNPDLLLRGGWINGKAVDGDNTFAVINPATQEVIAEVSDLGVADAERAIAAASAALLDWRKRPLDVRVGLVQRWAQLIEDNADDLGRIVCIENGKPYGQARGEALQSAALLRWFANGVSEQKGQDYQTANASQRNYTIKQPVGVVACITPWNFPAAAVAVKSGAALVTGCTTITKPSDETPLIALAFAKLSADAGIPAGVFNVIPCKNPAPVGDVLCKSSTVRMLSFTGSTKTGQHLYSACGSTIKRLALELGGNAPFIVFDDADIDTAVAAAAGARFYNSGQICVGANRFLIHDGIYDEFARRLADKVAAMTVGNGMDESSDIGPMINQAAIDRLARLVDSAVAKGATVVTGGQDKAKDGLFFTPTVMSNMNCDMPAYRTEIFGPVACLYRFGDEKEALQMANDTDAGLSAYVFTSDTERLQRCIEALEAGVVGANSANIFANDLPFGGIKQSGIGKEHGMQCLDEFVEIKSVCQGL